MFTKSVFSPLLFVNETNMGTTNVKIKKTAKIIKAFFIDSILPIVIFFDRICYLMI